MTTRSVMSDCQQSSDRTIKLDKAGMSVGVAREYIALLQRFHGTVVRLQVIAKRHFEEVSTLAKQTPKDPVPTDFLKKILRIFPNDGGVLKNVSNWADLLRFLKRKEETVRDRFQYLADDVDAHLNALSKKAVLDDADSLQEYADALQQLLQAVTQRRERTKDLLRANAKYQQELIPQMVFDDGDDKERDGKRSPCYHVHSKTPLPPHLLPCCTQLTEKLQRASTEQAPAPHSNQDVAGIVAAHGLRMEEGVTLANPDEPRHTAVLEQAICARVAGPLSPRIHVHKDEEHDPYEGQSKAHGEDDATSWGHVSAAHPHIAEPTEPGWVYVLGIREEPNGGRGAALGQLAEAAAVALHHNCPNGGWGRLQGHVFAYGLLQSEESLGVCAFALGHKLSEQGVYPRIYRRDVFLGPSHALPCVLTVLLERAIPRLTHTYEDALGWANHHPAICKEDLYFLKECSVRVVDGRVYSDMDIFDSTTATLKQFDRTVAKVWRAWRTVHFDHERQAGEVIQSSSLQSRRSSLLPVADDFLQPRSARSSMCQRSATSSRSSSPISRALSPCLSVRSTASLMMHSGDALSPGTGRKHVPSDMPSMTSTSQSPPVEDNGFGNNHENPARERVPGSIGRPDSGESRASANSDSSAHSGSSAISSHFARGRDDAPPIIINSGCPEMECCQRAEDAFAEEWVDRRGTLAVAKLMRHGRCVGFSTTYLGPKTGVSTREQLLDVAIQLLRLSVKGLVHGDVRNANVIMHGMRHAYLIDFETVHHEGAPFPGNLDTELVERHPQLVGRRFAHSAAPWAAHAAQTADQSSQPGPAGSTVCTYSVAHDWYALLMCFTMYATRDHVERFKRAKKVLKAYLGGVLQQHDRYGRLDNGEEFSAAELSRVRHIRNEVNLAAWP